MGERGFQEFLRADGLEDWVVLHGGATAAFRVVPLPRRRSWPRQWRRSPTSKALADCLRSPTIRLTVRLTRDLWMLEPRHVGLARAVSAVARSHGTTVWVQELDAAKPLRHAMHVDVSVAREHAEARLAAALAAGGRIVDESEAPAVWILADRAGNKVCIAAWPDGATRPQT